MGYENFRGEASIGDITAVITAIEIYVAKIVQIVNTMSVFKENEVACRRIIEVIEAKATVIDKKREIILNEVQSEGKNINTDIVRGEIEFKNVCFEYLSGQPILNNFEPVSYTHLDVYKRQRICRSPEDWQKRRKT